MPKDITAVLKEATKDLLTEETLSQINTVFTESVDKKVEDQVKLQLEAATNALDEKHAGQLKVLLERIDSDHSSKLEKIVQAINETHTRKLKQIVKKYELTINEEAKLFKNSLVGQVSNYLELYLEKAVPLEQIQEAVKVKKASKLITEMRKLLGVDLALGQEVIKEGIVDGKNKLTEANKKAENLVTENTELKARADKAEATLILEQKTAGLPKEKKEYVTKLLINKSAEFITENFDYTLSMFDKDQETILENLKNTAQPVTKTVDRPVAKKDDVEKIITEGVNNDVIPQLVPYMKELGKY